MSSPYLDAKTLCQVYQEASTYFFVTCPFGCACHQDRSCTCCQGGQDLSGVSPRPWVTSAFHLAGKACVVVSFQDQIGMNLLGQSGESARVFPPFLWPGKPNIILRRQSRMFFKDARPEECRSSVCVGWNLGSSWPVRHSL